MPRAWAPGLVLTACVVAYACSKARDPIVVNGSIITVENQTAREWRNVVVTVNDHFRGGSPSLAAGAMMTAPLSRFETAFGQRFAIGRQAVFKIEVTATDAAGAAVKLQWGTNKR
jgi:hypothetical protein